VFSEWKDPSSLARATPERYMSGDRCEVGSIVQATVDHAHEGQIALRVDQRTTNG
jgi:hypothetical protein